ncbi:hypothetical protein MWU52_12675 [Jannaschia sp. S6380]|uniref:hypothetical protein n=1 Tax=Jannaschia sp. S6380 TaxID=2926408 RepID=UPI001FF316B8|nr:hypothetical protein [Jannaschia sp. S6380]MCK0168411.1 hypothetical protein [Jannaschia sp. S6380]
MNASKKAAEIDVILHIGLHKTATTYIQNKLSALRYHLLTDGIIYPRAGEVMRSWTPTRDGAQSGHALLTRGEKAAMPAIAEIVDECPPGIERVILSSENFTIWKRPTPPANYLSRLSMFRSVKVVLVLRRQDVWIESYYKQLVDGFIDYETRSFAEFVASEGAELFDFHSRFSEWRDLVGPNNFHVMSYDDCDGADDLCRQILTLAGAGAALLDRVADMPVERYDSVRPIDTVALRILNAARLSDREARIALARRFFEAAPDIDVPLMTDAIRDAIHEVCDPINARIEAEWFDRPVPGLRFGKAVATPAPRPVDSAVLADFLDYVIAECGKARAAEMALAPVVAAPADP